MRVSAVLVGFVFTIVGCAGASSGTNPDPTRRGTDVSAEAPEAKVTGARKRLQGTWEIVRYKSAHAVPDDAIPLMADLFDSLRIQFEPQDAFVRTSVTANEKMFYELAEESGDAFKMNTRGGMFDGAACRFIGPDEWEVIDEGPVWPGLSVLRRVNH